MTNEEIIEKIRQWTRPPDDDSGREMWHGFWSSNPCEPSNPSAYAGEALIVTCIQTNETLLEGKYQATLTADGLQLISRNRTGHEPYKVLHTFPLTPDRDEFLAAVRMYLALTT